MLLENVNIFYFKITKKGQISSIRDFSEYSFINWGIAEERRLPWEPWLPEFWLFIDILKYTALFLITLFALYENLARFAVLR